MYCDGSIWLIAMTPLPKSSTVIGIGATGVRDASEISKIAVKRLAVG
jgi:hypothetical protein